MKASSPLLDEFLSTSQLPTYQSIVIPSNTINDGTKQILSPKPIMVSSRLSDNEFEELFQSRISVISTNEYPSKNDRKSLKQSQYLQNENVIFSGLDAFFENNEFTELKRRFINTALRVKYPLFEHSILEVGVISKPYFDLGKKKNFVRLIIYYGNKSSNFIEKMKLRYVYNQSDLGLWINPFHYSVCIPPKTQYKQELILEFQRVPFEPIIVELEMIHEKAVYSFNFAIPALITKFMNFKQVDLEIFKYRWKLKKEIGEILTSGEFPLKMSIFKSIDFFKSMFPSLVHLKSSEVKEFDMSQKVLSEFVGIFELKDPNIDYYIKFKILPGNFMEIKIAWQCENKESARFLLRTLCYLLSE